MTHRLGPLLSLGSRAEDRVGQLLDVATSMIKIDDPSPRQLTPGTAWVHHLFEDLVVIGAWVMALIADIDQTQALTIDLSENRFEQTTERIRDRSLTGFWHLPQINGPHALALAV